jgi:2-methoxy-6-polyprenyl-1,4-benzoquinol methylase
VAGGTGDIALRILDRAREKYSNRDVQVEIVDLNMEMLDEGRKRVAKTLYYNSAYQLYAVTDGSTSNILYSR